METLELMIIVGVIVWLATILYNKYSGELNQGTTHNKNFAAIADKYHTYTEVQAALREAGLESSNLIIGIDYTKSNEFTGKKTFHGQSLHFIDNNNPSALNPYQQVISILGKTLEVFDDDKLIPTYGFGDITTSDKKVFPFIPGKPCFRFTEVLEKYNEITPVVVLSGPTSFAPLIYEAIKVVKDTKSYHILVIIADGQVTSEAETKKAIVEASNYPISIVLVGVGDGPWDMMREFDDGLPARKFDNFQFVNFNEYFGYESGHQYPDIAFSVAALQEIPDQFKEIRRLKLL